MKKAAIMYQDCTAGWLIQDEEGYHFIYDKAYLESRDPKAISLTLPLQSAEYTSKTMFSFFDGLIPEGWLLEVAEKNWKLDLRDRMGLLMNCCRDCIGAVSVHPVMAE
ncbi:MAG: HipA N-terminal domain-containing protein [Chlorobiales bacterium]|nr:HipA N-terminal domain-containing protein [Chlorobiales bacterium]